jgi:exopolysaccharide production protein ExoQ
VSSLSIFIGTLVFLGFLFIDLNTSSAEVPRMRRRGSDFVVGFLLIANLAPGYLLATPRADALTLLSEDFSVGNIANIVITAAAALYLAYIVLAREFPVQFLLRAPYFSTFALIAVYLLTTAWSIVPLFTLYQALQLLVWVALSVYFFARLDSVIKKILFLALYCCVWFFMKIPTLAENLSQQILFSAIKDNFFPAMGFGIAILGWTTRWRLPFFIIGTLTFVLAGSAAALASAIAALCIGLTFIRTALAKSVGYIAFLSTISFMIIFLVIPEQFPDIIDFLSAVLQKPTAELIGATGRYAIWSLLWDATKGTYFGSGFGSDRFVQLLGSLGEVTTTLGSTNVYIMSAHDAVLSAWIAAGWLGAVALLFVFAKSIRQSVKYGGDQRATTTMTLIMIILNSLTIPGLGGGWSCIWLLWIAILSIVSRKESSIAPVLRLSRPLRPNGRPARMVRPLTRGRS